MPRHPRTPRAPLVALVALVAGSLLACGDDGDEARRAASEHETAPEEQAVDSAWLVASRRANRPVRSGRTAAVIRVAAEHDSAVAAFIRDSLDMEGWPAWITVGGSPRWRVNVPDPRDPSGLGARALALRRLRESGLDAREARDLVPEAGPVRLRGELPFERHLAAPIGARADLVTRLRWALRPDGGMFIVVADMERVGGAPEPDVVATGGEEEGFGSSGPVWDVAPSPDWRYLAMGGAHVVSGTEQGVERERWDALAKELGEPVALVRDVSFSISDEATRFSFVLPTIEDLQRPCLGDDPHACPRGAPATAGGWRVRWLRDGSRAAFGVSPRRVSDDAPATIWTMVDPTDGQAHGTAVDTTDFAAIPWVSGPVLDASAVDTVDAAPVWAGDYVVENRGPWIRVVEPDSLGGRSRVVGPGRALVATNQARYIAALVPRAKVKPGESPLRLVVYYTNR